MKLGGNQHSNEESFAAAEKSVHVLPSTSSSKTIYKPHLCHHKDVFYNGSCLDF